MPEFLQKPYLASGSVIPYGILEQQLKEAKEKEALRQQRKHDFLIATYGNCWRYHFSGYIFPHRPLDTRIVVTIDET